MERTPTQVLRRSADGGLAALAGMAGILLATTALAGPVPDYDFDWAVIGDLGNPAIEHPGYPLPPTGRGTVNHRYRIAKEEVTTAQWLDFVNTYSTQSDDLAGFASPTFWGAESDPTYHGPGRRYVLRDVPDAARLPVFGVTWRDAARYCNWLHNGKGSSLDAIANGAYGTSTFVDRPGGIFDDQATHNADARFWIPTWDEWLKAAHYNPATDSWNEWPTADGSPLAPGWPGEGTTSAGLDDTDHDGYQFGAYDIPLGAYDTVSAYGLLDVSGGAREWTEEIFNDRHDRVLDGMYAGETVDDPARNGDSVYYPESADSPWSTFRNGLRVASVVPAPATTAIIILATGVFQGRRKR